MNPPLGLRGIPQTIAEMERAGLMRFEEGGALISRGRAGAGVYLLGLSAEMLLKTSYFLVESFRTSELVPPLLGPTYKLGKHLLPHVSPEKGHSLVFWAKLILARRDRIAGPMHPWLARDLDVRAARMYQNWWIQMRYLADHVTIGDTRDMFEDALWLSMNYTHLWR